MKASLKLAIPGFTGRMKNVEISYDPDQNLYTARKIRASPIHVPDSSDVKAAFAFARRIVLSDTFLDDCHKYIVAYNTQYRKQNKALTSWSAIWLKMMKAQHKAYPELDLDSLSREEFISRELPCRSIATAVDAGYLLAVPGYQKFKTLV